MRNTEFLLAASCFLVCLAILVSQKQHLYTENDVQVFYYAFATEKNILKETAHGGAEYLNKITFLGDSRTYGLKAFSMLEGGEKTAKVWTPKNGTMSMWDVQYQKILFPENDTEITVAEAATITKPEILIISIGFNGVGMVDKSYFSGEYKKLIHSIKIASPCTTIILQSIFPVCRSYTDISNEEIAKGNDWIIEIAEETNCFYLNTAEVLTDENGFLKKEFSTDGYHLNPLGLDVQLEYICTHQTKGCPI